jgi:DNA polymerase III epsilon subunit-like protein
MLLYIDTTTASGQWLWKRPDDDPDQPPMIRLAAILGTAEDIEDRFCRLIAPRSAAPMVTPEQTLRHGIAHANLYEDGCVLGVALVRLMRLIIRAEAIVAHNADFHMRVIRRAFRDGQMPIPQMPQVVCTMRRATDLVRIDNQRGGRWKWPSLPEAYTHFAGYGLSLSADPVCKGGDLVDAVRLVHTGIVAAENQSAA